MAEPIQGLPTPNEEIRARAAGIARILNIPSTAIANASNAYHIMSHLAAMPTLADHGRRRDYGNEILANSNRLMPISQPEYAPFNGYLRGLVVTMQEFPKWYTILTKASEALVDDYILVSNMLIGMGWLGLGGLGAVGSVVKSGIKGATAASGGIRAVTGAALRGVGAGVVNTATAGLSLMSLYRHNAKIWGRN